MTALNKQLNLVTHSYLVNVVQNLLKLVRICGSY